ncbi:hypothetical protein SeMB42_g00354 [Synchytrium endobioticum]|uniref:Protein kinase domain-containing protein n=1 Tax=Synchytrium endobioticum TaxID=286115 RepID=A0A507DRF0_9FUNG|nr:hypothetical protein SeMB42_g00354 [Synchytrium endobioticum]
MDNHSRRYYNNITSWAYEARTAMDLDSSPLRDRQQYRDYRSGPLYKLTTKLLHTYVHINNVYYEATARKKRSPQPSTPTHLPVNPPTLSNSPRRNREIHSTEHPHELTKNNYGYDDENDDYIIHQGESWYGRFIIMRLLGRGSFGQVVEAQDLHVPSQHNRVAIKIIKNRKTFKAQALIEIKILEYLNQADVDDSKHIVRIKEYFVHRGHLCIVYEMLSFNLYELLKSVDLRGVSLNLVRKFAHQLLVALSFLSQSDVQVIHCDMKPENILLQYPNRSLLKVIDFGSSCFTNERTYSYIQSRFYRSPEVILGAPYSCSIDMWSLGCILMELLTGTPVFPGANEHDQLVVITHLLDGTYSVIPSPRSRSSRNGHQGSDTLPMLAPAATSYAVEGSIQSGGLVGSGEFSPRRALWDIVRERIHDDCYRLPVPDPPPMKSMPFNQHPYPQTTALDYLNFSKLVERMLDYDVGRRISPNDALKHEFFTSMFDQEVNTKLTSTGDSGESLVTTSSPSSSRHTHYVSVALPSAPGRMPSTISTPASTQGRASAFTPPSSRNPKPTLSLPSQQSPAAARPNVTRAAAAARAAAAPLSVPRDFDHLRAHGAPTPTGTTEHGDLTHSRPEVKRHKSSNPSTVGQLRTYNTRSRPDSSPLDSTASRSASTSRAGSRSASNSRARTRRHGGGGAGSRGGGVGGLAK